MTISTCAWTIFLIICPILLHQARPLQAACVLDEEFECSNGFQCIKSWFVCDGEIDCLDASDEISCQEKLSASQYLIVADLERENLFKVAVDGSGMVPLLPRENGRSPVAVALDYSSSTIYWTDALHRTINRFRLTGRHVISTPIFHGAFSSDAVLEGLALNTVDGIIFYGDAGTIGKIGSIGFTGTNHKILLQRMGMKPRTLILDPSNRYLYWTDWGEDPAINVASMDNLTHRTYTTLVKKDDTFRPNALAIDFSQRVMFWCDSYLGTIETALLDGTKRRTLYTDEPSLVYGMFLTPKYLYFSDWKKRSVQQMDRESYAVTSLKPTVFNRLCGITYFSAPTVSSTTGKVTTEHEPGRYFSGTNRRTVSQQPATPEDFDGSEDDFEDDEDIFDSDDLSADYERYKHSDL